MKRQFVTVLKKRMHSCRGGPQRHTGKHLSGDRAREGKCGRSLYCGSHGKEGEGSQAA